MSIPMEVLVADAFNVDPLYLKQEDVNILQRFYNQIEDEISQGFKTKLPRGLGA